MKTTPTKETYPTWSDILAILGTYIAVSVVMNIVHTLLIKFGVSVPNCITACIYVLTFGITIGYALIVKRLRVGKGVKLLHFGLRKTDPALILWGVVTVMATTLTIEPLLELFPSQWIERLAELMRQGGWMIFTTVVAAPILEEILFRGIIQESLTRKYGPWRGILVASAIFGIIHIIPHQVINAFFVGTVLGFIYYRTQSLIPVILIHAINNAISNVTWMLSGEKIIFTREMIANDKIYYMVYGISCCVFVLGWIMMIRTIQRDQKNRALTTTENKESLDANG